MKSKELQQNHIKKTHTKHTKNALSNTKTTIFSLLTHWHGLYKAQFVVTVVLLKTKCVTTKRWHL